MSPLNYDGSLQIALHRCIAFLRDFHYKEKSRRGTDFRRGRTKIHSRYHTIVHSGNKFQIDSDGNWPNSTFPSSSSSDSSTFCRSKAYDRPSSTGAFSPHYDRLGGIKYWA